LRNELADPWCRLRLHRIDVDHDGGGAFALPAVPDNTACVRFTKVEALDRTITGARALFGRTAAVRGSPDAAHPPERAGMSRTSGVLLNWRAFSQECDKGLIKTKRGRFL